MKSYLVTYLSVYGLHERFRTTARNKREAQKDCKESMGNYCEKVVEVEEI